MKLRALPAICAATLALCSPLSPLVAQESSAQTQTEEQSPLEMRAEQVVAWLNGEIAPEEIFTNGFLAAVPPSQLTEIADQLTSQFGSAMSVETLDPATGTRASLSIQMERAFAQGGIAIDASDDNRISELLFQNFLAIDDSPEKIEADLAALPGHVTWYFAPLDGQPPILQSEADPPMAMGSTFKLYVLAALAREIKEGRRSWDDLVLLPELRSYPSGMMQDWPDNAPVTLHTLASLMISISDNTATDALIRILGRDTVLQVMIDSGHSNPSLNDPFMTTRDLFLLKAGPAGRLEAYRGGDADLRTQILDGIEDVEITDPEVFAAFSDGPVALDVEWFASAADLANLFRFMEELGDREVFEIMAINPSASQLARDNWDYIGYKGGSEPGVLNFTWLLSDASARPHVLVLSWTNPDANVDEGTLELIAQRILALPINEPRPAAP